VRPFFWHIERTASRIGGFHHFSCRKFPRLFSSFSLTTFRWLNLLGLWPVSPGACPEPFSFSAAAQPPSPDLFSAPERICFDSIWRSHMLRFLDMPFFINSPRTPCHRSLVRSFLSRLGSFQTETARESYISFLRSPWNLVVLSPPSIFPHYFLRMPIDLC